MKTIFISQPMRNRTDDEIIKERKEIVKELTKKGYRVINSFIEEKIPATKNDGIYMLGKSIELMSNADIVLFLKGWENARGCIIEHKVAEAYELKIKEV